MVAMDIAYAIQETNNEINLKEQELTSITEQISALQKNLKSASAESKKQIVSDIKELGTSKNAILADIDKLLTIKNNSRYSGELGLIEKLAPHSPDNAYAQIPEGSKGFVGYMTDIAINDPDLTNKFIKTMENYYNRSYLSNYAKTLSRQTKLNETSGNIFENISTLPSFKKRLSVPAKTVLNNEDTFNEINSYLKKNRGGRTRKTYMKKEKQKGIKN